jgi:hypothetical protein
MNETLRGVIIRNFIYLIVFFVIYFPMVIVAQYMKTEICAVDTFTSYCNAIPSTTVTALNFLLYVAVPLSAFIWVFISSSEPQRVYMGR